MKMKDDDLQIFKEKKYEFTEKELKDLFNNEMSKEYAEFRRSLDAMKKKHIKELEEMCEKNKELNSYNWLLMAVAFMLCAIIIFVK